MNNLIVFFQEKNTFETKFDKYRSRILIIVLLTISALAFLYPFVNLISGAYKISLIGKVIMPFYIYTIDGRNFTYY